ncbi:DUF1902 domain-containing protein [Inquilinus sp. CAU 1745]|uniref:DUF1902 domain-containing protein n=1 Tax=Inquilinus sp. CAU 1745 TaxID=3140369 RepID=UPI00325AE87E
MSATEYKVIAKWDGEACGWYVDESDVPGLVTEAATFEQLVANIRDLVPDLLAVNSRNQQDRPGHKVPIHVMADRLEIISFNG